MPIDTTPYADDVLHKSDKSTYPPYRNKAANDGTSADIAHRPQLPIHPELMGVDVEDEEDDPVTDTGPGITDGPQTVVPPVEDDRPAEPAIKLPGQPGAPERV